MTPLHLAVCGERIQALGELLQRDLDVNSRDAYGNTPLHYAVIQARSIEPLMMLLRAGASVDIANNANQTPLDCAAQLDRTDRISKMLAHQGTVARSTLRKGKSDRGTGYFGR